MTDLHRTGDRPDEPLEAAAAPGGSSTAFSDDALEATYREGLTIKARSQWQLFRMRFLHHKLAMISLLLLVIICGSALMADTLAPYEYDAIDLVNRSRAPTLEEQHYFGTDKIGRDYFSRVLYGTRTSVRVAFVVALLSTAIGTVIGALAGYYRGWLDNLLMRMTDFIIALPFLAILLIISAYVGRGSPFRVALILAFLLWTTIARIVRGNYLSLREKEFVEAAKASGASDARIIFRHILPNTLSPIIVNATLVVALAILLESTLSFLGFGIQPPTPALGKLIDDGRNSMLTDWWLVFMPGMVIVTICLCINFIGDGLRDAIDPTQAER
jgi:ABC-type dipeptide/oligopeptide/nickel transport system permease subunit